MHRVKATGIPEVFAAIEERPASSVWVGRIERAMTWRSSTSTVAAPLPPWNLIGVSPSGAVSVVFFLSPIHRQSSRQSSPPKILCPAGTSTASSNSSAQT
ncbi:hypothetical protein BE18_07585 [Sorangium cellulosum]|uniref:Uncharacterized protein n=1 Tax=Sorangium cellulosum TaxID=56 RepID=A0A150S6T2_SORCE|nr:hypothetical protein BE18_07585 [Sorangium cellulosum]